MSTADGGTCQQVADLTAGARIFYGDILQRCNVIVGTITSMTPNTVTVDDHAIPFAFAAIMTGAQRRVELADGARLATRWVPSAMLADRHAIQLPACERLLVIGGGLLAVETAAELVCAYPAKHVILITRGPRLLARMPPRASSAAEAFLKQRGVHIHYNTSLTSVERVPAGSWEGDRTDGFRVESDADWPTSASAHTGCESSASAKAGSESSAWGNGLVSPTAHAAPGTASGNSVPATYVSGAGVIRRNRAVAQLCEAGTAGSSGLSIVTRFNGRQLPDSLQMPGTPSHQDESGCSLAAPSIPVSPTSGSGSGTGSHNGQVSQASMSAAVHGSMEAHEMTA
ncbi:hypothetical protein CAUPRSCDRAFT_12551, partial [Caulochytrium protostelioides]